MDFIDILQMQTNEMYSFKPYPAEVTTAVNNFFIVKIRIKSKFQNVTLLTLNPDNADFQYVPTKYRKLQHIVWDFKKITSENNSNIS